MAYGIFKRTQTIKTARSISRLMQCYLDQNTKHTAVTVEQAMRSAGNCPDVYAKLHEMKQAPQRPGVEFVESMHSRPVRFFGEIESAVRRNRPGGKFVSLEEDLKLAAEIWVERTRHLRNKGVHAVLSVSPELQAKLLRDGIPVEEVLFFSSISGFSEFNSWRYPNQALSYVIGYHSDKPNSHLHVLVYPAASGGDRLNLSRFSPLMVDGRSLRVDSQEKLHRSFNENLTLVEDAIEGGVPAPAMDDARALNFTCLAASRHVTAALAAKKTIDQKAFPTAEELMDEALRVSAGLVAGEMKDDAGLAQTIKHARRNIAQQANDTNSVESRESYLRQGREQLAKITEAYHKRTAELRATFQSMRAAHAAWEQCPDRVPDFHQIFCSKDRPWERPSAQAPATQFGAMAAKGNPDAREHEDDRRLERSQLARRQLSETYEQVGATLQKDAAAEVARGYRLNILGARLLDVQTLDRGAQPAYLNPDSVRGPVSDFVGAQDRGAKVMDLHVQNMARGMRDRHRMLNPDTDAIPYTGGAADDESPTDLRSDEFYRHGMAGGLPQGAQLPVSEDMNLILDDLLRPLPPALRKRPTPPPALTEDEGQAVVP